MGGREFGQARRAASDKLKFKEFAQWYSRYGYCEDVLLTQTQRWLRELARKYDLHDHDIERYKARFDDFDIDGDGRMAFAEFGDFLCAMAKVPAHLNLPPSRVKQFWKDTDVDDSGTIDFEEFVIFFKKLFNARRSALPQTFTNCRFQDLCYGVNLDEAPRRR